jgi:hypothetical protein
MMPYFSTIQLLEISWFRPQIASTMPAKPAIFAEIDGATAGAMKQEFCDRFSRFLETTETISSRSRLNARWRTVLRLRMLRAQPA